MVHNAGITRDKTLGRLSEEQWDAVIAVNLTSQERINEALLERGLVGSGGRIVSVSSQECEWSGSIRQSGSSSTVCATTSRSPASQARFSHT